MRADKNSSKAFSLTLLPLLISFTKRPRESVSEISTSLPKMAFVSMAVTYLVLIVRERARRRMFATKSNDKNNDDDDDDDDYDQGRFRDDDDTDERNINFC
ncbi:unnamed protein product [Lasius platythorax]|uniref:Uncharacterized protein n=1 Tax=Lasius platythorax TaxID=488582 RepID=A0AAV2P0U8_9HYME